MSHSFLIHHKDDDVAVAIEDVEEGRETLAVALDTGARVTVTTRGAVPLGHKVALRDLSEGEPVRKYGLPIGETTQPVAVGDYVHTHNLRSSRW